MDAAAFTLDDHIYFGDGGFNPQDGIQIDEITLIGHEATHVRQYRQSGSKTMKGKYLLERAKGLVGGTFLGGENLGSLLSYFGNKFEREAFNIEKQITGRSHVERKSLPVI
jgi:hypothetical protein